jgi:hypothetical protein
MILYLKVLNDDVFEKDVTERQDTRQGEKKWWTGRILSKRIFPNYFAQNPGVENSVYLGYETPRHWVIGSQHFEGTVGAFLRNATLWNLSPLRQRIEALQFLNWD